LEKVEQNYSKIRIGEGDVKFDQDRLQQAIQEEKKRKANAQNEDERSTKKQKGGFEVGSHDVTEEELGVYHFSTFAQHSSHQFLAEAYRMTRRMQEDPMANYVDQED
jgi:pre-mRNA-processing factor SLU7